jgi:hypothetical protein
MQRSSESIACLAAALAKAQAELTNPEKSLVATIRPDGPGEAERSFRYAIAKPIAPATKLHVEKSWRGSDHHRPRTVSRPNSQTNPNLG